MEDLCTMTGSTHNAVIAELLWHDLEQYSLGSSKVHEVIRLPRLQLAQTGSVQH